MSFDEPVLQHQVSVLRIQVFERSDWFVLVVGYHGNGSDAIAYYYDRNGAVSCWFDSYPNG